RCSADGGRCLSAGRVVSGSRCRSGGSTKQSSVMPTTAKNPVTARRFFTSLRYAAASGPCPRVMAALGDDSRLPPDARIEPGVGEVDHQVERGDERRVEDRGA